MLLLWVLWPTEDTPGICPLPFFTSNGVATATHHAEAQHATYQMHHPLRDGDLSPLKTQSC